VSRCERLEANERSFEDYGFELHGRNPQVLLNTEEITLLRFDDAKIAGKVQTVKARPKSHSASM
jgi:hypothetical protein